MILDHYEIRVSDVNIYGNFITAGILWYIKEYSAPSPQLDNEMFISPPNIIDKLLGITFARKIEIAKVILEKKAKRRLMRNQELQTSVDKLCLKNHQ